MLKFKDSPHELMQALERFLSVYFGDRQVENQIDTDEIAGWNIPQPLKDLYSFVGKYPGKQGILSSQDVLYINSGQGKTYGGKIIVVGENNGCWSCFTDTEGEDPPVWTENYGWKDDSPKWKLVNDSLSQFLITFCLQEAIFASKYLYRGNFKVLVPTLKLQGYEVTTWQGRYLWEGYFEDREGITDFHMIEDAVLISSDGWCGTNYKNANRLLTSLVPKLTQINMNCSLATL